MLHHNFIIEIHLYLLASRIYSTLFNIFSLIEYCTSKLFDRSLVLFFFGSSSVLLAVTAKFIRFSSFSVNFWKTVALNFRGSRRSPNIAFVFSKNSSRYSFVVQMSNSLLDCLMIPGNS